MKALQVQPGSIVVGVDDTREAEAALDWAIAQAHLTHQSLTLVHAVGNKVAAWVNAETEAIVPLGPISQAGRDLLKRTCAHVDGSDPSIPVVAVLRHTGPLAALTSAAAEARGLVVGIHHQHAHRTGVLDPIGQLLRHGARCPITEVGPSSTIGCPKILVVVDGTTRACRVLAFAFARAALTRLPLSVTVVPIGALPGHLLDCTPVGFEGNLIRMICNSYSARFPELNYEVQSQPAVVLDALNLGRTTYREMILDEHHLALVDQELYNHSSPLDAVETTTVLPNTHQNQPGPPIDPHRSLTQSQVDQQVAQLMQDLARLESGNPGNALTDTAMPALEPARIPRHRRFMHGS
jgi:hypothetical protein